jgi:hypothetical protein
MLSFRVCLNCGTLLLKTSLAQDMTHALFAKAKINCLSIQGTNCKFAPTRLLNIIHGNYEKLWVSKSLHPLQPINQSTNQTIKQLTNELLTTQQRQ